MTKYVPEDSAILKSVKIKSNVPDVQPDELKGYIHQQPNNYFLGFWRMQLGFYNLSKDDSTKWVNRWLRKIGEPPVVYDSLLTESSIEELQKVMNNKGYLNAEVSSTTNIKKRQAKVTYQVNGNTPYTIRHYFVTLPNNEASNIINDEIKKDNKKGDLFDVDILNKEREHISKTLRNHGFFNFRKELLFFYVDSALNTNQIDIELSIQPQYLDNDSALQIIFQKKIVSKITIVAVKDADLSKIQELDLDTIVKDGYSVVYNKKNKTFRPSILVAKTFIKPNEIYNESDVTKTYTQLNSLNAAKYVNITFKEIDNSSLNATIFVTQNKPHTISTQIEGTYSGGDLGVGLSIGYKNNNIFRGSEILDVGINGGYEAIGSISNFQSAWDIGGDISLTFPQLLIPGKKEFRKNLFGNTKISTSVNFQQRPEYRRNIANAGFKYDWNWHNMRFSYNLIDISYVYLPYMSEEFEDKYMKPSSSIRFSYENHFIMLMGFNMSMSNRRIMTSTTPSYYTFRFNVRTAGNLLYGISSLFQNKDKFSKSEKPADNNIYKIFGIQYSQFAKADIDYAYNCKVNDKIRFVFHTGLGVGVPYANSTILPFEERYYSGGANSMRGWSARTLGPGNFYNPNKKSIDFMKQSGDIKFDLNLEARFRLFWKLEAAVFMDAGNIWTIRNYEEQPTGVFKWNEFYKQIACNYGLGLRLDFDFFVIRVDMGIKLYDPGYPVVSERWRTELRWKDDFAIHFAVGYPF